MRIAVSHDTESNSMRMPSAHWPTMRAKALEVPLEHQMFDPRLLSLEVKVALVGAHRVHAGANSCSRPARLAAPGTGFLGRIGNSSWVRPSRVRPASAFRTPPHCLKKNGILAARHCVRMSRTHDASIGRAPGPLSPPTMTQWIPARSIGPKSSRSGSIERNATFGSTRRSKSMRGSPARPNLSRAVLRVHAAASGFHPKALRLPPCLRRV